MTDVTINVLGVFWVLVCAVSTALYLLLIAKIGRMTQLSNTDMLYVNNLVRRAGRGRLGRLTPPRRSPSR